MEAVTQEEALDHAIRAAEVQLVLLKAAKSKSEKASLKSKFNSLIERAETIKQLTDWPPTQDVQELLDLDTLTTVPAVEFLAPVSNRQATTYERKLILKASKLHGFVFPPWERNPGMGEFSLGRELDDQYFKTIQLLSYN